VASSSTFGLGQINRKKQMIQSAIKTQDKTINQQHYPPKNTMNEPSHS
jgi:dual specificity tyrosine-phosphorylation-regulated kinase 2/3/4